MKDKLHILLDVFRFRMSKETGAIVIFLCFLILLAYFVPTVLYSKAAGTDVYTHMYYTQKMSESNSLNEFYDVIPEERAELGYNYPFGLWLFGSIVSKITGMHTYYVAYILPALLILIIAASYYLYSGVFFDSQNKRLLSIIFLLSMPIVSIFLLRYRSSIIALPFLLIALYAALTTTLSLKKSLFIILFTVLSLCFIHTGTFLFLVVFTLVFVFLYALIWGKFHRKMFLLFTSMLLIYMLAMSLTPYIQAQYVTKFTLITSIGGMVSSKLHLPIINSLSVIFYNEIFVKNDIPHLLLWLGFIYISLICIIHLRWKLPRIKVKDRHFPLTLPLIGRVDRITHSVIATPFWAGPIQTTLSLIGFFGIDKIGKCVFLTVMATTLIPASFSTGSTGALREIYYLLIIFPIVSVVGLNTVMTYLTKVHSKYRGLLTTIFLLFTLSSVMVLPIIGNIYYLPTVSGTINEVAALQWLSGVGTSEERCVGYGYRDMIGVYADKTIVFTGHGSETRRLTEDIRNVHFSKVGEESVKDLYSAFNAKYIISSNRVLKSLSSENKEVVIASNTLLDKLYSGNEGISIYKLITNDQSIHYAPNESLYTFRFNESYPLIQDSGSTYLTDSISYRIRVGKKNPKIHFIGESNGESLIGDGYLSNLITLARSTGGKDKSIQYNIDNLVYPSIRIYGNQITYETVLSDEGTPIATLFVKYTFYQKSIKKEMIVANDVLNHKDLSAYLHTHIFSPLLHFTFQYNEEEESRRRIYKSEDTFKLKDEYFNKIYFNDGETGIYLQYDKTSPYPREISYKGSTLYDYGFVGSYLKDQIKTASNLHVTQYISVGEKEIAKDDVNRYTSVSRYPYPHGEIPIILISTMDRVNSIWTEKFENSLNAHEMLRNITVTEYTEGITMNESEINVGRMNRLLDNNAHIIVYEDLLKENSDLITQRERLHESLNRAVSYYNMGTAGFIPNGQYNLETIHALVDEDFIFAITNYVGSPYYYLNKEGLRSPKFAYYHGEKTDLVLLPISGPTSAFLRAGLDIDRTLGSWRSNIDFAVDNDDLVIFLWDSETIGKPEYISSTRDIARYAQNKGMTFTTPDKISKHYRLLHNISTSISREMDSVDILLDNGNNESVKGVTFKVVMPKIEWKCPYFAENGVIMRTKINSFSCEYYLSTDLEAKERKTLTIKPNIEKKTFLLDLNDNVVEGEILFQVKDHENKSVSNAIVCIDGITYKTNKKGLLKLNLRRGVYPTTVEKPGFNTHTFDLEVKGRITLLQEITLKEYLLMALTIVVFSSIIIVLHKTKWVTLEFKKAGKIEKEIELKIREMEDRVEHRK